MEGLSFTKGEWCSCRELTSLAPVERGSSKWSYQVSNLGLQKRVLHGDTCLLKSWD